MHGEQELAYDFLICFARVLLSTWDNETSTLHHLWACPMDLLQRGSQRWCWWQRPWLTMSTNLQERMGSLTVWWSSHFEQVCSLRVSSKLLVFGTGGTKDGSFEREAGPCISSCLANEYLLLMTTQWTDELPRVHFSSTVPKWSVSTVEELRLSSWNLLTILMPVLWMFRCQKWMGKF